MSAEPFIDTNVLIYAFSEDDAKAGAAEAVLAAGGIISVQVLHEFTHVCRRKLKLDWPEIAERLTVVKTLLRRTVSLTTDLHEKAVDLASTHNFSVYDALIIAAALSAKCEILLSEDLQHGRMIEGLRIENPFLAA